jgi:DNA sulfur modification protein DndD
MIIEAVRLKNYRQYKGSEIVCAVPEGDKNFTIIQGVNGSGKTTLLNAITWCLYGEEKHLDKKNKGLPIVNSLLAEELEAGATCDVEVELRMRNEDQKVIFRRMLQYRKNEEGTLMKVPDPLSGAPDGSRFEVLQQTGSTMQIADFPDYIVRRHIPESIEEFFFFDGERLNNYFREATGEKIRNEVFKISQLDALEKAIEHLQKKEKDFLRENKKLSPKAKEIREKLENYEDSLDEAREKLNVLKNEKREAEFKIQEFSEKLRISGSDIGGLEEERIQLEERLKALHQQVESREKERFDYLLQAAPVLLVYDALQKTRDLIDAEGKAGDIPAAYMKRFLNTLLETEECICGNALQEDTECRKKIETLLQEYEGVSSTSDELTVYRDLGSMLYELKDFREIQIAYGKDHRSLTKETTVLQERLETINDRINACDVEQIKFLNQKLDEYKMQKESHIGEISVLEHRINEGEKATAKLKRQLDDELKKEEKSKELRKILQFCEKGLQVATEIKEGIMEDIRKEIEAKTEEQFLELIWKKETYKDVNIDGEYTISIVHESGMEGIGTLSAGERQVLALSFMAALNSVSGFDAPIVIDTPLGRLSREPKNNIAQNLPNYLEGKQVILLVTEEEYTPEVREKLYNRVGKEYRIYFEETPEGSEAKVVPYA